MSRGDELEPRSPRQLTGLDAMFANTNIVILILFGFCCGYIALILGIVGLVASRFGLLAGVGLLGLAPVLVLIVVPRRG